MITNISSSVMANRVHNRNRNALYHRNGLCMSAYHYHNDDEEPEENRCCKRCLCPCSNRVLTCIVITILPIAITSTLICVFMMQKTNLHEYAIYTFVVFCVAFVFPFALFFITVILNKIYKLYKRRNVNFDVSSSILNCQHFHHQHNAIGNDNSNEFISLTNNRLCQSPSPLRRARFNLPSDYLPQRVVPLPPYYYAIDCPDFTERYAVSERPIIDDNPPSYEMAILCPSVPIITTMDINIEEVTTRDQTPLPPLVSRSPIPAQPPPPYNEKTEK